MDDLDLGYSYTFMYFMCQLSDHRLQQFLENLLLKCVPIQTQKGANFTLLYKWSRSTQGHNLNKLGSTRVLDAAYQVSRSSAFWFQRRRFFKVLDIYMHGGHIGHESRTI